MYGLFGFNSIREDIIFIAAMSVILIIALIYDYRRKKLEKMQKDVNALISDIEMHTKHRH